MVIGSTARVTGMPARRLRPAPPAELARLVDEAADEAAEMIDARLRRLRPAGRVVALDHLRSSALPGRLDTLGRQAVVDAIALAPSARALAEDLGWSISSLLEAFGARPRPGRRKS